MDDKRDEKLDQMLRSRRMESASAGLAQRIILQARQLPQNKIFSPWHWLGELCSEFHLPKPVYVLASALIFGLVIGFSTPIESTTSANDDSAIAQSVFAADEALL
ncbi:MAG TPA: hypothetical protein VH985_24605 [Candidatus Binatia bacterium]|jgi:hypothetical protein